MVALFIMTNGWNTNIGGAKMKYSSSNKPLECMMTQSTCYKGTKRMTVKGVLWHSTGANNPNLKRYVQPDDNAPNRVELLAKLGTNAYKNDWNHIYTECGLNCWIGKLADGTVATVQTMPWDYRPWGCGSGSKGSCNDGWIQFEICEDALTDSTYFNKIYKEACEITAYLCRMFNIDPHGSVIHNGVSVPTILCHADSHSLGLGSGHADVNHWFPKFGKSMSTARDDVASLLKTTGGNSNSGNSVTSSNSNGGASTSSTADITAGTKLNLQDTHLYGSSSIKTSVGTKTGTYYVWSNEVVNGRIRITNNTANVGKTGQVTGWIDYEDAKKTAIVTDSVCSTGVSSNVIYQSLGVAAKRKGASTSATLDSRCAKGGYYAASQLVTPATGNQQWFRHVDTDLYSALTDTNGSILFSKYGIYAEGKTNASVNIRASAGLNGTKLTQFTQGTTIYLTGKIVTADGLTWAQIVYDGKLVWCDKQWINY